MEQWLSEMEQNLLSWLSSWLSEMEQNLLSWLSSWLSENHLSWINFYFIPIVIIVLIIIVAILVCFLVDIYESPKLNRRLKRRIESLKEFNPLFKFILELISRISKLKRRTESLKKFNPQIQFHSLPKSTIKPKFKKSTEYRQFGDEVSECFFVGGSNFTQGNMGSIDFVTYDYEYSKELGPGSGSSTFRGTAIFLQSDQLVLPSFKWDRKGVQPGTPPKAKEEAGSKQCPTCGSWDVHGGAKVQHGHFGWCDHCKKSLYKMNEEKARKLFRLVSIGDLRGWTVLASNTQLLLYQRSWMDGVGVQQSMVPAKKYQEFMEKALKIFQMFQSASQNLNEHA